MVWVLRVVVWVLRLVVWVLRVVILGPDGCGGLGPETCGLDPKS